MNPVISLVRHKMEIIKSTKLMISELLVGKTIRITTKFWCDQPIGSSKPNQSGKHFRVREVYVSGDRVSLFIGDFLCSILLEDVEVID